MVTLTCASAGCGCLVRDTQLPIYVTVCDLCDHSRDTHVQFTMMLPISTMQRVFTSGLRRRDQHAVKSVCKKYAYTQIVQRGTKGGPIYGLRITSKHREKYGACAICHLSIRAPTRNRHTGQKRKKTDYAPIQLQGCKCWSHVICESHSEIVTFHVLNCAYTREKTNHV